MTTPSSTVDYAELERFPDYPSAQAVVDKLADSGFEVRRVRIVGNDLHSVEQVTGRLTVARAAMLGAASGAWFGIFLGFLFGLFTPGVAWITVILVALVVGAVWGAIFGAIAQWATRGQRDFSSVKTFEAGSYSVMVESSHLAEAARIAGR